MKNERNKLTLCNIKVVQVEDLTFELLLNVECDVTIAETQIIVHTHRDPLTDD